MRLEITPEAEADLRRIYDFNASRSIAWADKVETRLLERARGLAAAPRTERSTAEPGILRVSVPDIQYVIFYEPAQDQIRILRIFSTCEIR